MSLEIACPGCEGQHGNLLQGEQCVLADMRRRVSNNQELPLESPQELINTLMKMRGIVMLTNQGSATIDDFDRKSIDIIDALDSGKTVNMGTFVIDEAKW